MPLKPVPYVLGALIVVVIAAIVIPRLLRRDAHPLVLTNTPGVITGTSGQLHGSFVVELPIAGTPAIPAMGTGGACYVADLNFAGYPGRQEMCTSDDECRGANVTPPNGTMPDGWLGYCVQDPPNPAHVGRCWVRPGPPETHCRRSKDEGGKVWPLGEIQQLKPIDLDIGHNINPVEIKWRIHACLNKYDLVLKEDIEGCTGLARDGPTFQLPNL